MAGPSRIAPPSIALLLACAVPAAAQKVEYDARFPAKNRAAAKLTSVAVLPFRGSDGANFTSALIGALQSSTLDGQPYFSVKTLEGMNYVAAPPAPPPPASRRTGKRRPTPVATPASETAEAVQLGRKLGVAAVYMGEVSSPVISRREYSESKRVCTSSSSKGKCTNYQDKQVPCVSTTANYTATPRLVDVATGGIVYSASIVTKADYDVCGGEVKFKGTIGDAFSNLGKSLGSMFKKTPTANPNQRTNTVAEIKTDADLVTKVRHDAADAVRYDVAPFNFTIAVEFKQKAPELGRADQVKFASASAFAKAKRLDRACSDWETLNTPANSGSINLLFNLGVCQEVLVPEDPNAALTYLAKADSLTTKPDPMINKALERLRNMDKAQVEISRQVTGK